MLGCLLLIGASLASEPWPLPHAGKALNQNELTYFHDCMIVEVSTEDATSEVREVSTPMGKFDVELRFQSARVVSSNFDAGRSVTLSFTKHMPHTQEPGKPGWTELPLKPGRYFVMGLTAKDDKLRAHPGAVSYGWPDKSVYPEVPVALFASNSTSEFSVFHIVSTSQGELHNAEGNTGKDVLDNLVSALLLSEEAGAISTLDLLMRTGHLTYKAWTDNAAGARQMLAEWDGRQTSTVKALNLLTAYNMGHYEIDIELFHALSRASAENPLRWDTNEIKRQLLLTNPVLYPSSAQRTHLESVSRQVALLQSCRSAGTEAVRFFLMNDLRISYNKSMDPSLNLLLRGLDVEAPSTNRLLSRLSTWFKEPGRDPKTSNWTSAELVQYWQAKLGG